MIGVLDNKIIPNRIMLFGYKGGVFSTLEVTDSLVEDLQWD